jgi:hypothetical protein
MCSLGVSSRRSWVVACRRSRTPSGALKTAEEEGQTFLSLGDVITRQGVFYFYAVLAAPSLAFFVAQVPETQGRRVVDVPARLTAGG